jgi:CRISPR/Cas system-associated endonuclease Cas3-HD
VRLGILLHDLGWALVNQDEMYREAFGPRMYEAAVRIEHEKKGAALAREILESLGYPAAVVEEVETIVDGHDTRKHALSRNDELVKDADKLWRFSIPGVSVACDWFSMTPAQYADRVEREIAADLFTEAAVEIATRELAHTRAALRLDLLREAGG